MSTARLENALRRFDDIATLVRRGGVRQTWRFEFDGRVYFVYFWERGQSLWRRLRYGNPAQREFFGLQTLQKTSIPSPRAIAQLSGFRIAGVLGDAVIVEAIEPSQRLDEMLLDHELRGEAIPQRRQIALQMRTVLHELGRAGLGNINLTLASFLVSGQRVFLRDGRHVRRGGLRDRHVMRLAHDAQRFATRSELVRAWRLLMPGSDLPKRNPLSPRLWRRELRQATRESDSFGRLRIGRFSGIFTRRSLYARAWAAASRITISRDDWQRIWPTLLKKIESGDLHYLKRDPSGEVMQTRIDLSGRSIEIVIKRPKRKQWYRYLLDLARPARARRTWKRTWRAIVRDLPTEWPLLLMEKRLLGYVTDAMIIFEHVPGKTLDQFDLDHLDEGQRQTLFRRAGKVLRQLERRGLGHYDAKSTNWIVYEDPQRGPTPVMIDCDGIHVLSYKLQSFGVQRLLRAMRQHKQYTPADSLALCRGFAPFSPLKQESGENPTAEIRNSQQSLRCL